MSNLSGSSYQDGYNGYVGDVGGNFSTVRVFEEDSRIIEGMQFFNPYVDVIDGITCEKTLNEKKLTRSIKQRFVDIEGLEKEMESKELITRYLEMRLILDCSNVINDLAVWIDHLQVGPNEFERVSELVHMIRQLVEQERQHALESGRQAISFHEGTIIKSDGFSPKLVSVRKHQLVRIDRMTNELPYFQNVYNNILELTNTCREHGFYSTDIINHEGLYPINFLLRYYPSLSMVNPNPKLILGILKMAFNIRVTYAVDEIRIVIIKMFHFPSEYNRSFGKGNLTRFIKLLHYFGVGHFDLKANNIRCYQNINYPIDFDNIYTQLVDGYYCYDNNVYMPLNEDWFEHEMGVLAQL